MPDQGLFSMPDASQYQNWSVGDAPIAVGSVGTQQAAPTMQQAQGAKLPVGSATALGTAIAPGVGTAIGAVVDIGMGIYEIVDGIKKEKEAKDRYNSETNKADAANAQNRDDAIAANKVARADKQAATAYKFGQDHYAMVNDILSKNTELGKGLAQRLGSRKVGL